MCGIAGIARANQDLKITEKIITDMLLSLEIRGRDATGISWQDTSKKFYILKTPARASDFVQLPEYKENIQKVIESPIILLHTRAATQGWPGNNQNNHPIFNKKGIIIHNGVVRVPAILKGDGETDSEQILLYIQKYGFREGLSMVNGWMSIAYVSLLGGELFLYAEKAPLTYFKTESGAIVFASTYTTLQAGFNVSPKKVKDVEPLTVFKVVDNKTLLPIASIKRSVPSYETYAQPGKINVHFAPGYSDRVTSDP